MAVGSGLGVGVGGNQTGVAVLVGASVGASVGEAGANVTMHAEVDSKNNPVAIAWRERGNTIVHYSERTFMSLRANTSEE